VEFVPAVALAALVLKFIDFLRYAKGGDVNGVVTQLAVWFAGFGALLLVAQTQWADTIPIGDTPLAQLSVWDMLVAGLSVGSVASAGKDLFKSIDAHNSSKIPTLLKRAPLPDDHPGVG